MRGFMAVLWLGLLAFVAAQADIEEAPKSLSDRLWSIGKAYWTGELSQEMIDKRNRQDVIDGVVRLTDETYKETVEQGDKDTLWVIMIHEDKKAFAPQTFHEAHTAATKHYTELSSSSSGLSSTADATGRKVVFARMEYHAEWRTCTRWLLFRPPQMVFVSDQGRSLRFITPQQIRHDGEELAKWIKRGHWAEAPTWHSSYGPGGDSAWLVEKYISAFDFISSRTGKVPAIVWLTLSGMIAKLVTEQLWTSKPKAPKPGRSPSEIEARRQALRQAAAKAKSQ